ncbi:hypothetical protein [Mycobacterium sp. E3247]|uniref:hypothetical protein n=1 Tax=Mycobacterium sp. E3247 TaxID=1856864 RepID=UPI00080159D0|nr:hypothetical protein [Mycobacterium sp. E3247]OBH22010.1 hypothetical protein A9X04_00595 [Mycobacterium sp. E3247]
MQIHQKPNAGYPKIIHAYVAFHAVLIIAACSGLWYLAVRSTSHGIAPNTKLGFRSQHTLVSAQGWYVAQKVGFHFAATAVTMVTVVMFAVVVVAYARRLNPMWLLIVPLAAGIAVGVCLMIAGYRADHAAVTVETPNLPRAEAFPSTG